MKNKIYPDMNLYYIKPDKQNSHYLGDEIGVVTVEKVGRTKFYLKGLYSNLPYNQNVFYLKTLSSHPNNFTVFDQLYLSEQDIFDMREKKRLCNNLRKIFNQSNSWLPDNPNKIDKLTLDQLEKINLIIEEKNEI